MTVNFQVVILVEQFDTMISSERERVFLEAETSVFNREVREGKWKQELGEDMLAKISKVAYIIAAVLHYANGQMDLFWLSVVLGIFTTGLGLYMSYYHVSPQLREFRETVYQMEADGASDDEIEAFMDQDTDVDESKLIDPPTWMALIGILGIVASFVLLIMGIMGRI